MLNQVQYNDQREISGNLRHLDHFHKLWEKVSFEAKKIKCGWKYLHCTECAPNSFIFWKLLYKCKGNFNKNFQNITACRSKNRRRMTEISRSQVSVSELNILFSTDICAASHNHSLMHTLGTLCTKNIMCKTHLHTLVGMEHARNRHTYMSPWRWSRVIYIEVKQSGKTVRWGRYVPTWF